MSVADVLRRAGFGPQSPHVSPKAGEAQTQARCDVPTVPKVPSQKTKVHAIHTHLLALADDEGLEPALVHNLTVADLQACEGLPDAVLVAYLHVVDDTATRNGGRVPTSYTAPAYCRGCGPVWLPPETLDGLAIAHGLPIVLACPWCHTTPPPGHHIPRPTVTCATCRHWTPDTINPSAGLGHCGCEDRGRYPNERHPCAAWSP